jgi:hypothetical protein
MIDIKELLAIRERHQEYREASKDLAKGDNKAWLLYCKKYGIEHEKES